VDCSSEGAASDGKVLLCCWSGMMGLITILSMSLFCLAFYALRVINFTSTVCQFGSKVEE